MKKLNILVVEDGRSQREMLRDFLIREGHTVAEAENGEQALQAVRKGHFDLVLLDYRMPGMNGMQVLLEVKRVNPEIDVVIITAYGTIDTAVDAMKAGALDYITKPLEFEELLILVDRVAERRTLIRENEILRAAIAGEGENKKFIAGDGGIIELAILAHLVYEAADLIVLRNSLFDGLVADIDAIGLVQLIKDMSAAHSYHVVNGVIVVLHRGVHVHCKEFFLGAQVLLLNVFHAVCHLRAGGRLIQTVEELEAALKSTLQQGAAVLAGEAGHVVGTHLE